MTLNDLVNTYFKQLSRKKRKAVMANKKQQIYKTGQWSTWILLITASIIMSPSLLLFTRPCKEIKEMINFSNSGNTSAARKKMRNKLSSKKILFAYLTSEVASLSISVMLLVLMDFASNYSLSNLKNTGVSFLSQSNLDRNDGLKVRSIKRGVLYKHLR